MTTSAKKKSAQTSLGKKEATEADRIDEYNFFVSSNGNGSDEALKEALKNGIIKSKKSIDFFLPE
jgi:hypothetical protein